jgi:hypothetical protein
MNPPFGGRNGHVPWLRRFLDHGVRRPLSADTDGGRKVAKDFREQFVIDMHMDGLPSVDIADPLEHGGNASRVEVGFETRESLERTNVELVGVFEGNLRFVRYRLCHLVGSLLKTSWSTIAAIKKPGLLHPSFHLAEKTAMV